MKLLGIPTPVVCAVVAAAAVLSIGGVTTEDGLFVSDTSAQTVGGEIKIALLSDFGHKDAFNYAVDAFNREQSDITTSNYYITSRVIDLTDGDPCDPNEVVVDTIKQLESEGFRYFIGPMCSSTADRAKVYTDNATDIVLLSPASTATSLAIERDSLFRLVPDDFAQAVAISEGLIDDGKRHIVLIYRNDIWGEGLRDAIIKEYAGNVALTIRMDEDGTNAPAVAAQAAAEIDELVSEHGADAVAVVQMSFVGDTIALVEHIASDAYLSDTLGGVKWYGADGTSQSSAIAGNAVVARFMTSVGYVASQFEAVPNPTNRAIPIQSFTDDSTYGYNTYDAVFLLADTVIVNDEELAINSASTVRSLILDVAAGLDTHEHHHADRSVGDGALGEYRLGADGDMDFPLTYTQYEVYQKSDGSHGWRPVVDTSAMICR